MLPSTQLIQHLNRGGFGYFWIKHPEGRKETVWFDPTRPIGLPEGSFDLYFGVNPSRARKGATDRATLLDICAVNCLFAEFDAKDFGNEKGAALEHIRGLKLLPSVLVDSGGGYHAYWLLEEPALILTSGDLNRFKELQARWVHVTGGDPGAKDLARVLRVPGTYNHKYNPPREVTFLSIDLDMPYYLEDFYQVIPKPEPVQAPPVQRKTNGNGHGNGQRFDDAAEHWTSKAMDKIGELGGRNHAGWWLARQLQAAGLSEIEAENAMRCFQSAVKDQGGHEYIESEALATLKSAYRNQAMEPARGATGQAAPVAAATRQAPAPAGMKVAQAVEPKKPAATVENDDEGQGEEPGVPDENRWPLVYKPLEDVRACYELQETGDADLLAAMYAGRVAYDHAENAWYAWQGHYWKRDAKGMIYQLIARRVAPQYLHAAAEAARLGNDEISKSLAKRAAALRNKKRMDNVLFLAARHEDIALTGDEWDANPWLLGCANGVIELKSGAFRPGKPDDYIRAHSAVEWAGMDAQAPRWEQFVLEVFDGDADLARFMARLLGYGITGLTTEHALPILWGEGRNGKSTMLEVLADVLSDDLATSSQADALMDATKGGDGPKPFVFGLRGKRLVWASESNEGRRINAGLVKQLTGGDRLNVRTLHSKPVEFKPSHLLMLLTNHRPHINADDNAIWERVHLVPFKMRFIDKPTGENDRKRDPELKERLQSELPGVLAWLVRGCLTWQHVGLNPPDAVKTATAEYREEEDTTGLFISERCEVGPYKSIKAAELYLAYSIWCKDSGLQAMSLTAFGKQVKRRFPARQSNGILYDGIGLAMR